jgi:hypothetical protein
MNDEQRRRDMTASGIKRLREWVEIAESKGWRVVEASGRGGHLKWYRPDGSLGTVTPGTPSGGRRSMVNARAQLRRAGLREIR